MTLFICVAAESVDESPLPNLMCLSVLFSSSSVLFDFVVFSVVVFDADNDEAEGNVRMRACRDLLK